MSEMLNDGRCPLRPAALGFSAPPQGAATARRKTS